MKIYEPINTDEIIGSRRSYIVIANSIFAAIASSITRISFPKAPSDLSVVLEN